MPFPALFGTSVVFGLAVWGAGGLALYLASAKRTSQPRKPEAHPTAAWVQVPRIGFYGAGCCVSRLTCRICPASSLRRFHNRHSAFASSSCPGNRCRDSHDLGFQYIRNGGPEFWFYQGSRISLPDTPGLLGSGYCILAPYLPLLLITHDLAFRILLRTKVVVPSRRN